MRNGLALFTILFRSAVQCRAVYTSATAPQSGACGGGVLTGNV